MLCSSGGGWVGGMGMERTWEEACPTPRGPLCLVLELCWLPHLFLPSSLHFPPVSCPLCPHFLSSFLLQPCGAEPSSPDGHGGLDTEATGCVCQEPGCIPVSVAKSSAHLQAALGEVSVSSPFPPIPAKPRQGSEEETVGRMKACRGPP